MPDKHRQIEENNTGRSYFISKNQTKIYIVIIKNS